MKSKMQLTLPFTQNFTLILQPQKSKVENRVNKLLNDGIIRASRSTFNLPIWIVPKNRNTASNTQYRMVIDYRKLNSITFTNRCPITVLIFSTQSLKLFSINSTKNI